MEYIHEEEEENPRRGLSKTNPHEMPLSGTTHYQQGPKKEMMTMAFNNNTMDPPYFNVARSFRESNHIERAVKSGQPAEGFYSHQPINAIHPAGTSKKPPLSGMNNPRQVVEDESQNRDENDDKISQLRKMISSIKTDHEQYIRTKFSNKNSSETKGATPNKLLQDPALRGSYQNSIQQINNSHDHNESFDSNKKWTHYHNDKLTRCFNSTSDLLLNNSG